MIGPPGKPHNPHVDVKAKIADQTGQVGFRIDSGSTVNTLLYQDYKRLLGKPMIIIGH